VNEAKKGDAPLAAARLNFLAETKLLDVNEAAVSLARQLIRHGRIPQKWRLPPFTEWII